MIQEPISTEEIHLQGIPVSPGIALGKIRIQIKGSKEPVAYDIEPDEVDSELVRFHRALQTTAVQIRALRERMIQISGEKEAAIFDAHILLLQDKIILDQVRTELARRLQNVEHIFYVVMQNYMEVLRRVGRPLSAGQDGGHGGHHAAGDRQPAQHGTAGGRRGGRGRARKSSWRTT